jgi:hypothetical protein
VPKEIKVGDISSNASQQKKRVKYHNNLPALKNINHLDKVNFDIDSPLFSKACKNLGLTT